MTATTTHPVLADRLIPRTSFAKDAILVGAATVLVALSAQVSIPMYPVPITAQTLVVLLAGATLGSRRAASAMAAYLFLGLAGIPWFAGFTGGLGSVYKPSLGYIIGFIPAAFVLGYLAQRKWDRNFWKSLGAFGLGVVLPFVFGVAYLYFCMNMLLGKAMSLSMAFQAGVVPFIPGEVIKWLIAAALVPSLWALVNRNKH